MPYFKWEGIDLSGAIHYGVKRIASYEALDRMLLAQQIALLRAHQARERFLKPISNNQITWLFKQLAVLMRAGIFLDQALILVCKQVKHSAFKAILLDLKDQIIAGESFGAALSSYSDIFDCMAIQLMYVGQESGSLQQACDLFANIGTMKDDFYKKIRKVMIVPCITLLFFCLIVGFISVWIVPILIDMLTGAKQQIPPTMQYLLQMKAMLCSPWVSILPLFIFGLLVIIKKNAWIKNKIDLFLTKIPVLGSLLQDYTAMHILYSLGLLVRGKVPLHKALFIMQNSIKNDAVLAQYRSVQSCIDEGRSLSYALQHSNLFFADIVAIVAIGEESGHVGESLLQVAEIYKERINYILFIVATIMQPLLLAFLGGLILFLISAIYMPIITVSYTVS